MMGLVDLEMSTVQRSSWRYRMTCCGADRDVCAWREGDPTCVCVYLCRARAACVLPRRGASWPVRGTCGPSPVLIVLNWP